MRESIDGQLRQVDIWQKGLDTLRATRRQTLSIAAAGLLLPQLVVNLALDARSAGVIEELRTITENSVGRNTPFTDLLAPALGFASSLGFMAAVLLAVALAAYLALVHVAVLHHRGDSEARVGEALRTGARLALKRGVTIVLLCFAIIFIGQALIAPALVAAILALVLPVVLVAEGQGGWAALRTTLAMRYVRGTPYGGWTVLFSLLSLGATLYVGVVLIALLSDLVMRGDEILGLPRAMWAWTFPGLPFGPVYLAASIVESVLLVGLVCLFPSLTAALYFTVVGKRTLTQA